MVNIIECNGCEILRDKIWLARDRSRDCRENLYEVQKTYRCKSRLVSPKSMWYRSVAYEIQHCLTIVIEYGWRAMVEGTILLTGWFCFAFSCDMQFFFFAFLWTSKIDFRLYMPFFLLVAIAKRRLGWTAAQRVSSIHVHCRAEYVPGC